ncbi:MAG: preprotein translocase subunit SecE [Armatimonadetes bacterium]|nr:preprotein translocase subunit SecE [Anaerolineae bacterium]
MSTEINEGRGRRRRPQTEPNPTPDAAVDAADEMAGDDDAVEIVNVRAYTAPKGRPTAGRRNQVQSENEPEETSRLPGFLDGVVDYVEGSRNELQKVNWPTRTEALRLLYVVLAVTAATSIVLGLISFAFTTLFAAGVNNPLLFVLFFAVAGAATFFGIRYFNRSSSDEPTYPTRLM